MTPSSTPKEQPPADPAAEIERLREQVKLLQEDAEKSETVPTVYDRPGMGTGHLEERLARITGYVSRIPKRGYNAEQKYPFVAHPDVLDAIRPALAAELVQFRSKITKVEAEAELVAGGAERRTGGGMVWRMWRIEVEFRFVCWREGHPLVDDGPREGIRCEQITEGWPGFAQDYSDKGASKALTSAIKTFLIQQFLLSTGDDPDNHEIRSEGQQQGGQQQQARPAQQAARPASGDVRQARNAVLDLNKDLPKGVVGKIAKKVSGNGVIMQIEDAAVLRKVEKIALAYKANPEKGEAWLEGDNQALAEQPAAEEVARQDAHEQGDVAPTASADADRAEPHDYDPVTPVVVPYDAMKVEDYDPPLTEDEKRQHALGLNPRIPDSDDDTPF